MTSRSLSRLLDRAAALGAKSYEPKWRIGILIMPQSRTLGGALLAIKANWDGAISGFADEIKKRA
jgi:hypothetical protein